MQSHDQRRDPKNDPNPSAIQVGDAVAYSRDFLRSIGAFTGDMPHARGKVTGLHPLGRDTLLAEVEWDKPDLPAKVNVKNLCRPGDPRFSE